MLGVMMASQSESQGGAEDAAVTDLADRTRSSLSFGPGQGEESGDASEVTDESLVEQEFDQQMQERNDCYKTLATLKRDCWESEQLKRVFDLRYRNRGLRGSGDGRPRERGEGGTSTSVSAYHQVIAIVSAYHQNLLRVGQIHSPIHQNFYDHLPMLARRGSFQIAGAKVLDMGCAPGGTSKFWIEECNVAGVVGVAMPTSRQGFPMQYKHERLHVVLRDITAGSLDDLIADVQRAFRRQFGQHAPFEFDIIHCGAVVQSFMTDSSQDAASKYRQRQTLMKRQLCLAVYCLKQGGHLVWLTRPLYNSMMILSHLLPLFSHFKLFRTNFRIKSQVQIVCLNHRPTIRKSPSDLPSAASSSSSSSSAASPIVACPWLSGASSRRSVYQWMKSMPEELDQWKSFFCRDDRHSMCAGCGSAGVRCVEGAAGRLVRRPDRLPQLHAVGGTTGV
mmetsp:Transcript_13759/g.39631  ORF Transcript_13759/g.39631 Transcript_13759/m.39631 type:complete len:448 (-) Transcript_13759:172-1515(-)